MITNRKTMRMPASLLLLRIRTALPAAGKTEQDIFWQAARLASLPSASLLARHTNFLPSEKWTALAQKLKIFLAAPLTRQQIDPEGLVPRENLYAFDPTGTTLPRRT